MFNTDQFFFIFHCCDCFKSNFHVQQLNINDPKFPCYVFSISVGLNSSQMFWSRYSLIFSDTDFFRWSVLKQHGQTNWAPASEPPARWCSPHASNDPALRDRCCCQQWSSPKKQRSDQKVSWGSTCSSSGVENASKCIKMQQRPISVWLAWPRKNTHTFHHIRFRTPPPGCKKGISRRLQAQLKIRRDDVGLRKDLFFLQNSEVKNRQNTTESLREYDSKWPGQNIWKAQESVPAEKLYLQKTSKNVVVFLRLLMYYRTLWGLALGQRWTHDFCWDQNWKSHEFH